METLSQYIKRLDDCIERAKYAFPYDKETVQFLEDLKSEKRPKQYHSCDDPFCVICGSPLD